MATTVLSAVKNFRAAATYIKYMHWRLVRTCQYGDSCSLFNLLGLLACGSKNFKTLRFTREFTTTFANIRKENILSKCIYKRYNILGHKTPVY